MWLRSKTGFTIFKSAIWQKPHKLCQRCSDMEDNEATTKASSHKSSDITYTEESIMHCLMTYSITCLLAFGYNCKTHHIWDCTQPDGYPLLFKCAKKNYRTCIQCGAKRTHVFQIIVTLFIFNINRNHVNTKTTCNKCSFDYLH